MKRAALLVSYLFCYAGSSLAQSNDRQLAPSRVGKVHLGMTVDSLYEVYGRENVRLIDRGGEGGFNPAMQVFHPSEPRELIGVADVGLFCGAYRLRGISVVSPRFRTSDGLGVWSTVAEVKRKQPTAKMNREEAPSLIVEKLGMTFATSDDTFADSTRIVSVWLWGPMPDSLRRCRR